MNNKTTENRQTLRDRSTCNKGQQVRKLDHKNTWLLALGFPGGSAGKESACNVEDLGFIPGLGRFPWRRELLPTPVFWPGEFCGLYSPWVPKSWT